MTATFQLYKGYCLTPTVRRSLEIFLAVAASFLPSTGIHKHEISLMQRCLRMFFFGIYLFILLYSKKIVPLTASVMSLAALQSVFDIVSENTQTSGSQSELIQTSWRHIRNLSTIFKVDHQDAS